MHREQIQNVQPRGNLQWRHLPRLPHSPDVPLVVGVCVIGEKLRHECLSRLGKKRDGARCVVRVDHDAGDDLAILFDDGAHLKVASIGLDTKRLVQIRISKQRIGSHEGLHCIEGLLHCGSPRKGFGAAVLREGCKHICAPRLHVAMEVHCPNETVSLNV